ncbi:aminotransferase class I/II-fold pyridoxal phosphate-dependent enzyme, partial [Acinetobacter baumannii]
DVILIESPAPYGLFQSLEAKNMLALEVIVHPDTGLDLDQLQIAIKQHKVTACVLTTTCNTPLGCSMSKEKTLQLLKILNDNNIPLIEDDALGALSF